MGRRKEPEERQKILKFIRVTPIEDTLLNQMMDADDTELSPFIRKLIREEAQRRGYPARPEVVIITQGS
jgi:DNA-binding transcriptional MocR family regulator